MSITVETDEYTLTYDAGPEIQNQLYTKMLGFYKRHHAFSGESVMQCDGPQLEAPELLAEIAEEIFNFDVEWK